MFRANPQPPNAETIQQKLLGLKLSQLEIHLRFLGQIKGSGNQVTSCQPQTACNTLVQKSKLRL